MAFQDYFSVVAFFIFLRETLEASVIIAVLLQCMNRTAPRLKKQGKAPRKQASRILEASEAAPTAIVPVSRLSPHHYLGQVRFLQLLWFWAEHARLAYASLQQSPA